MLIGTRALRAVFASILVFFFFYGEKKKGNLSVVEAS